MKDRIFVDTWGWVALGHKKDSHHQDVVRFYREAAKRKAEIVSSDFVLDELITLLFRRENSTEALEFIEGLLSSASLGYIMIETISSDRFNQAWDLRRRFKDAPFISFTDLTSMVLMKEMGIKNILTGDQHFFQVGFGFQKVF
jgi:predicted nucleic acid-binding protein